EAFFLDAQAVDLNSLESSLITELIAAVRNTGVSGAAVAEWVPVYGTLLGVFSIKRGLRPAEIGRLKQTIFKLENEIRSESTESQIAVPRLINHFLWLLDHYENSDEEEEQIKTIQMKIKLLNPVIYESYMSGA
ncbi:MAG: hypothetical protein LBC77_06790, partial [Spirochaetaceae bacterium]|nr:hypothetical protein [Spirochaetaceae bacterium]